MSTALTTPSSPEAQRRLSDRARELHEQHLAGVFAQRDRVFAGLFCLQWVFALVVALVYSPRSWEGKVNAAHLHVWYALVVGGLLTVPPILFIVLRPGTRLTRHVVASTQMLWSALLIHLTGGRIETHFHVFGSLAFLSYYRDWKVLLTATIVVASDHLLRELMWPESVYGIANPEWWRFLEHALWVVFEDVVLVLSIVESRREMRAEAWRQAELEEVNATIEQRIVERTRELAASRDQFRELVETTKTIPFELERTGLRFTYVGPQAVRLLGLPVEDWYAPGFVVERLYPDERQRTLAALAAVGKDHVELEFRLRRHDGTWTWARMIVAVYEAPVESGARLRGVLLDVTETRALESELRQAQKLESVGRLAAGVAHEINTPVQFVSDSVHFMRDAFTDLGAVLRKYDDVRVALANGSDAEGLAAEIARLQEEADLGYLMENVPKALERSLDGLDRVATIVRSMKEFAHPDQKEMTAVDLNQTIRSTLVIAHNEYKYVADLETDFGELPSVQCLAGEVNQVVLNIVVNAAHAIGDVVKGTNKRGRITVSTRSEGEHVVIAIRDTGGGIPEHVREHIFDPFFTTKEVGRGTGQGLAIARSVVIDKHGGELWFETEMGKGTTFFVRLPLAGKQQRSTGVAA